MGSCLQDSQAGLNLLSIQVGAMGHHPGCDLSAITATAGRPAAKKRFHFPEKQLSLFAIVSTKSSPDAYVVDIAFGGGMRAAMKRVQAN